MNIYLKYKLKLLIKEYNRLNNINLGYTQNKYELNGNSNNNLDNYNIDNENISQKKPRKKIIQQNNDNFLITGLHEYEGYEESDNSNPNINNYEDENEYDNQINEIQNNNINSPNKKFSEEQIEKVNQRFNYISQKLLFDIENEKIEYSNLKDVFDKLYVKTNNIYMNILKNTYFEQNINNSSTTGNNNSSQTNNNNQSTLPSIYQSTSSSKNLSKANKKPKEGYMSKKRNKELVIKFLEKEEIKRIIYKMLYDD